MKYKVLFNDHTLLDCCVYIYAICRGPVEHYFTEVFFTSLCLHNATDSSSACVPMCTEWNVKLC